MTYRRIGINVFEVLLNYCTECTINDADCRKNYK